MLPGFTGSLVSAYFAEELLADSFGDEIDRPEAADARSRLLRQRRALADRLGPASGPRQVYDLVTEPMASALGHRLTDVRPASRGGLVLASADGPPPTGPLFVTSGWGDSPASVARDAIRAALAASRTWCVCVNGTAARLLDARRSYARRYSQFDLDAALDDERAFAVLWTLLRSASFLARCASGGPPARQPLIDRIVDASDRNTVAVCRSLREGVLQALGETFASFVRLTGTRRAGGPADLAGLHQQALTVVYRILFLLFAESRRLVPDWHPVYRDSYSIEAVRSLAERPGPVPGLWETLQAISRLSHAGCQADSLRVTPFNGRLFSPSATPLAERPALDDETARRVVLALSSTPGRGRRARIDYRDLDVEQLGAVYERVLEYAPRLAAQAPGGDAAPAVELNECGQARKATSSFYTPRALTTYLVRRTLAPLVAGATPEAVLALRVVDPAMGSGAFLVAACRYLAGSYEAALVGDGRCLPSDIDEADRRGFRRLVAQRCLYGVDLNPMAVQLARLSLWLATLAPDRPLTFLDHRLLAGNSLVGASIDDVLERPGAGRGRHLARPSDTGSLSLFGQDAIGPDVRSVLPGRAAMAERPDDCAADIREKERLLGLVAGRGLPLARWRSVLDLWCAGIVTAESAGSSPGLFLALADHLLTGRSALGASAAARLIAGAGRAAASARMFHWPVEFPEVFYGPDGTPLERPGFDAVVGNPPWDMLHADLGGRADRAALREWAAGLTRFARKSGVYRAQGDGHLNSYQLFVERATRLARAGGRVGLVVPWGLAADHGCARLRRLLLDRTTVDGIVAFDNAGRIFPIHRSVRFLALSLTNSGRTGRIAVRPGEREPSALEDIPADESGPAHFPVVLSRPFLERVSGDSLAIPDLRSLEHVALVEKLFLAAQPLSSTLGWGAGFGRELNATEDSRQFTPGGSGMPVLEGKHVEPFRALISTAGRRIAVSDARRILGGSPGFGRDRLAYRDVSSPTNRLTLIAAVVPAGCVTVHTLFCLRTPLAPGAQHFLCGLLNSLVANFIVRLFVSSHVTTAIVGRLPAPKPDAESEAFRQIATLAAELARSADAVADPAYPRLQALVARLYGLSEEELEQVLDSFPLIDRGVRDEVGRTYRNLLIW